MTSLGSAEANGSMRRTWRARPRPTSCEAASVDRNSEEVRLGAEEMDDQGCVDPGLRGDGPHRRVLVAALGEELARRIKDLLARRAGTWTPPCAGGLGTAGLGVCNHTNSSLTSE